MLKNWRKITLLALPSLASYASSTATGTISLIMVGKLGALSIAVVGVCNIIMYNVWALCSGVGNTVNYLVAQNYGSDDMKTGVERTYIAFYLCIIASIFILLAGLFGAPAILHIMGNTPQIAEQGVTYLRIRFYAMIFTIFSFVFQGFLRGIEDTKTPMIASLLGNAVMIFFTYALTYGHFGFPRLELTGASLGVLFGEIITFVICAFVYFILLHPKYLTRIKVSLNLEELKLIFAESGKLGTQEFSMSMAMFIFTVFVSHIGTVALAANEVSLNIMSFGFMPAFAFGSTATILVGQEIGRGNPLLGRKYGTETAMIGCIFLFVLGIIEFIFAGDITRIFTNDPHVYTLASNLIKVSAFLQIFDGMLNFYAGGLRGIGDTSFLLKASLVIAWCIFVPLTYLLTFVWGLGSIGAWLALYTHLTIFGSAVLIRFYKTDWLSIKMRQAKKSNVVELPKKNKSTSFID